jgi:hypothetical protein
MKVFLLLTLSFLFGFESFSQYTFNYANWTAPGNCNVFDPIVNLAGHDHSSVDGWVQKNAFGIRLVCYYHNGFDGTTFKINYPFKKFTFYKITLTSGSDLNGQTLAPKLRGLLNINPGYSRQTPVCTDAGGIDGNVAKTTIEDYQQINALYNHQQTYDFVFMPKAPYADVDFTAVSDYTISNGQVVYVSNIVISEIGKYEFQTSVTPNTLSCGATTSMTFTVNNPDGISTVTGYTWNLGSNNNGWNYNGSPAPQTITTTTNTLTLTPNCSNPGQVQVSPSVEGAVWNTYSINIPSNIPSLSVTGNDYLCSSDQTYNITNLPCGSTISWNAPSPAGIVTQTVVGNTVSLHKIGNGLVNISASVQACGQTIAVTSKNVNVGVFISGFYTVIANSWYQPGYQFDLNYGASMTLAKNDDATFICHLTNSGLSNINWTWSGYSPINPIIGNNGLGLTFHKTVPGTSWSSNTTNWTISANHPCGTLYKTIPFQVTASGSFSPVQTSVYLIAPNPATTNITITIRTPESGLKTHSSFDKVNIYDQSGLLKLHRDLGNTTSTVIDLSSLPAGNYYVEIIDGSFSEKQQLQILK